MFKSFLAAAVAVVLVEAVLALRAPDMPAALGQAAAGPAESVLMATVQGPSNEPYVFLYDVASKRLCVYALKSGIEIRGARECTYDQQLHDLINVAGKRLSVDDVKNMVK